MITLILQQIFTQRHALKKDSSFLKALPVTVFFNLFLLIAPGLAGCSSARTDYPGHWPQRAGDLTDYDFSGKYHPALVRLLTAGNLKSADTTDCLYDFVINLSQIKYREDCPGETTAGAPYVPLSNVEYDFSFVPKKDGLQIIYRPAIAGNPVAGYQKEYLQLYKSKHGDLIVEKVEKAYGMVFILIPIVVNQSSWYRFHEGKVEITEGKK